VRRSRDNPPAPTPSAEDVARLVARLDAIVTDLTSIRLRVGFVGLPGDRYNTGESVAEIAASHEYGLGVPTRPFMSIAVHEYRNQWVRVATSEARRYVRGDVAASHVVRRIGIAMVAGVKAAINSNIQPPNSPERIEEKRSSRTLIDTGVMLNSVRAAVDVPGHPSEIIG